MTVNVQTAFDYINRRRGELLDVNFMGKTYKAQAIYDYSNVRNKGLFFYLVFFFF